jgi:hypothetical protein
VDFILQQGGGYQTHRILERLIAEKDTIQLKKILDETKDEYLAEEVAEALATLNEEMAEQPEDTQ